jgi:hypothetical protein
MALSIAERYNFKIAFGGRGKSVWLVCACVICSRSTAYLPERYDVNYPRFHVIARRIFFKPLFRRAHGRGEDTERASYVLIGSLQGFCRRLTADSLLL